MALTLSKSAISSYCGDILPLHLGFDSENHDVLAKSDVKWESDSDSVTLRTFSGDDKMNFNNGVLLILNKPGNAKVTARLNGECYSCSVTVREKKTAKADGKLNFYRGDLHNHTTRIHDHDEFITRDSEFQYEFINQIKDEGLLDFCAMSDHAIVLNDTEFFRNFVEVEKARDDKVIMLAGAESEVTVLEDDRFGVLHKNSGEIVTLNTDGYCTTGDWKTFCNSITKVPDPIAVFAHPCTVGIGHKGIWNFNFHKINTPELLNIFRGIETINGRSEKFNLMHEFNYSLALDAGFRVSPVASSDSHGPARGFDFMKAKTVILAPQKDRESFIDALRNNRFYATESGNVKLSYTVNGKQAPADLDETDSYRFHVELSYFEENDSTVPVECSVVSDGGKTLLKLTNVPSSFDFEINSETARYFYLRFVDRMGCRTWSMPVWTGRSFDKHAENILSPVDMSKATAVDLLTSDDAYTAIDGNVHNVWKAQSNQASILVDLQKTYSISSLGIYPQIVAKPSKLKEPEAWAKWQEDEYTSTLPTSFEVYTSIDGKIYQKQSDGIFRIFGGENVIEFKRTSARYVRLDILSTVGKDALPRLYGNAKCTVGNLTVFE